MWWAHESNAIPLNVQIAKAATAHERKEQASTHHTNTEMPLCSSSIWSAVYCYLMKICTFTGLNAVHNFYLLNSSVFFSFFFSFWFANAFVRCLLAVDTIYLSITCPCSKCTANSCIRFVFLHTLHAPCLLFYYYCCYCVIIVLDCARGPVPLLFSVRNIFATIRFFFFNAVERFKSLAYLNKHWHWIFASLCYRAKQNERYHW